uniref:Flavin-containing monooxygenase n=1 Tax=Anolis carolinensis TaxID=28377 RepID=A0A803T373_ANOCA
MLGNRSNFRAFTQAPPHLGLRHTQVSLQGSEEVSVLRVSPRDRECPLLSLLLSLRRHYSVPFVPAIPGLDGFPGLLLHSHFFRRKEPFAGLSEVVLVGGGASGVDLALLLSDAVTGHVFLSHRGAPVRGLPSNVAQVPPITRVDGPRVVFEDGSEARPEALLLCTGYRARFPFLPLGRLGLREAEHGLAPLYRHLLPPAHPTLFLLGLCQLICPFPHFHCQTLFALAVLSGRCPLPSAAEMEAEAQAELEGYLAAGGEPRHFLRLQERQWGYTDGLAQAAGSPSLPAFIREIWDAARGHRSQNVSRYRGRNYRMLGPDAWEVVEDSDQDGQAK